MGIYLSSEECGCMVECCSYDYPFTVTLIKRCWKHHIIYLLGQFPLISWLIHRNHSSTSAS